MNSPTEKRWRAITGFPLRWKAWDERELLVYHGGSGQTHRLSLMNAAALERLEQGSLSPAELTDYLASFLDVPHSPALSEQVQRMLQEFDRLGLIERVAP